MAYQNSIENFLSLYLSRPGSALPKNALWVVSFEGLTDIKEALKETAKYEPSKWILDNSLNLYIGNDDYTKTCFFVQAVSVPGEQAIVVPEGIQQNAFLRTPVGSGRSEYSGLQMTFLDSNINFVDGIIRPWIITTARLGMIARSKSNEQYRQKVRVVKLGTFSRTAPTILQEYTFTGVCPINVASEEYNYTGSSSPTYREVTFSFLSYKLHIKGNSFYNSNNTFTNEAAIPQTATFNTSFNNKQNKS
jgi:hypothetical protein